MSATKREEVCSHLRYIRLELREMHQMLIKDDLLPDINEAKEVHAQLDALLDLLSDKGLKKIKSQYGRIFNIFGIISFLYLNPMSYEAGSKECRHLIEAKESLLSALDALSNINSTDLIQIQIKEIYNKLEKMHDNRKKIESATNYL